MKPPAGSGRPLLRLRLPVCWERRCATTPASSIGQLDVEATFLLAIPLLDLPRDLSGVCRLAVEIRNGSEPAYAGAMVTVEGGRAASCLTRLSGDADAWAAGTALDWLCWVNSHDGHEVELGGDTTLAVALGMGLRQALAPDVRI
jgi:hypothetical protein